MSQIQPINTLSSHAELVTLLLFTYYEKQTQTAKDEEIMTSLRTTLTAILEQLEKTNALNAGIQYIANRSFEHLSEQVSVWSQGSKEELIELYKRDNELALAAINNVLNQTQYSQFTQFSTQVQSLMNDLSNDKQDGALLRQALVLTQESQIYEISNVTTTSHNQEKIQCIRTIIAQNIVWQWDHKQVIQKKEIPAFSVADSFQEINDQSARLAIHIPAEHRNEITALFQQILRNLNASNGTNQTVAESILAASQNTQTMLVGISNFLGGYWHHYFSRSYLAIGYMEYRVKEPPVGDAMTFGLLSICLTLMLLIRFVWRDSGKQFKYRLSFIMYEAIGFQNMPNAYQGGAAIVEYMREVYVQQKYYIQQGDLLAQQIMAVSYIGGTTATRNNDVAEQIFLRNDICDPSPIVSHIQGIIYHSFSLYVVRKITSQFDTGHGPLARIDLFQSTFLCTDASISWFTGIIIGQTLQAQKLNGAYSIKAGLHTTLDKPDPYQEIIIQSAKSYASEEYLTANRGVYAKALAILEGNHQKGYIVHRYVENQIEQLRRYSAFQVDENNKRVISTACYIIPNQQILDDIVDMFQSLTRKTSKGYYYPINDITYPSLGVYRWAASYFRTKIYPIGSIVPGTIDEPSEAGYFAGPENVLLLAVPVLNRPSSRILEIAAYQQFSLSTAVPLYSLLGNKTLNPQNMQIGEDEETPIQQEMDMFFTELIVQYRTIRGAVITGNNPEEQDLYVRIQQLVQDQRLYFDAAIFAMQNKKYIEQEMFPEELATLDKAVEKEIKQVRDIIVKKENGEVARILNDQSKSPTTSIQDVAEAELQNLLGKQGMDQYFSISLDDLDYFVSAQKRCYYAYIANKLNSSAQNISTFSLDVFSQRTFQIFISTFTDQFIRIKLWQKPIENTQLMHKNILLVQLSDIQTVYNAFREGQTGTATKITITDKELNDIKQYNSAEIKKQLDRQTQALDQMTSEYKSLQSEIADLRRNQQTPEQVAKLHASEQQIQQLEMLLGQEQTRAYNERTQAQEIIKNMQEAEAQVTEQSRRRQQHVRIATDFAQQLFAWHSKIINMNTQDRQLHLADELRAQLDIMGDAARMLNQDQPQDAVPRQQLPRLSAAYAYYNACEEYLTTQISTLCLYQQGQNVSGNQVNYDHQALTQFAAREIASSLPMAQLQFEARNQLRNLAPDKTDQLPVM